MFERISDAAEKLAANIGMSRRGFLGRVGQAALGIVGVAIAASVMSAKPARAQDQPCPTGWHLCDDGDHCCKDGYNYFCKYNQRTGKYNKCHRADTDEDYKALLADCSGLFNC
jgi:hypothetical protein